MDFGLLSFHFPNLPHNDSPYTTQKPTCKTEDFPIKKVIVILVFLLLLTGCRSKPGEKSLTGTPSAPTEGSAPAFSQEIAREALSAAMEKAKTGNSEEAVPEPAYLSQPESRVTWTVLSIEEADTELVVSNMPIIDYVG